MNGRPDSDRMMERGPRLGRSPWALYFSTGAALAILRVALFAWVIHRASTQTVGYVDRYVVEWVLYPEGHILDYSPFFLSHFSWTASNMMVGSLVVLVSFVIAMPILPLGWLMRRRRQNAGR
jgi:hypothetical protein